MTLTEIKNQADCKIYLGEMSQILHWPKILPIPQQRFCILLIGGGESHPNEIGSVASLMLDQGLIYLCAWGPGCEKVHDIFDDEIVRKDVFGGKWWSKEDTIMTAWHANETIEEAVEFFLNSALPNETLFTSPLIKVILVIGDAAKSSRIVELVSK